MRGRGLGTSIASSIKDKTIASIKGVTEGFDPLNIATAFGGSLGGYAFGRLTGRSRDDISYFTGRGGPGSRGSFMDSRKNKNPLVTKVGAGEKRPIKKGEGLADVLARIFNLLKTNSEEVKRRQEITANFEEEKEDERALRHKEIIEAISKIGKKRRNLGSVREVGKDGMFSKLLGMMKSMIENAMKAIKPILDFVKSMMKVLGGNALKFLKFLGALASPAWLSVLLPVATAGALLYLAEERNNRIDEINKNPNDPKFKDVPLAMKLRGLAATEGAAAELNRQKTQRRVSRKYVEDLVNSKLTDAEILAETGASRGDLKEWLKKNKEPSASFQQSVRDPRTGDIIIKAGDPKDNLEVIPSALQTPEQRGFQPGGSKPTAIKNIDTTSTTLPTNSSTKIDVTPMTGSDRGSFIPESKSMVTPAASPVSERYNPVAGRMQMAQRQNFDLTLADTSSPEPIIINKNNVVGGGDSGDIDIIKSASVRTDSPTLRGIQKQNLRSFA
jgi:hypothetical protein